MVTIAASVASGVAGVPLVPAPVVRLAQHVDPAHAPLAAHELVRAQAVCAHPVGGELLEARVLAVVVDLEPGAAHLVGLGTHAAAQQVVEPLLRREDFALAREVDPPALAFLSSDVAEEGGLGASLDGEADGTDGGGRHATQPGVEAEEPEARPGWS